jgi:hypothetical protein
MSQTIRSMQWAFSMAVQNSIPVARGDVTDDPFNAVGFFNGRSKLGSRSSRQCTDDPLHPLKWAFSVAVQNMIPVAGVSLLRGSNARPFAYEANATTTELRRGSAAKTAGFSYSFDSWLPELLPTGYFCTCFFLFDFYFECVQCTVPSRKASRHS